MRKTFIETLSDLARKDKGIVLLTGDLGYSVFEPFAQEFPNQFINCGVMEQSMVSIAAGLALAGKKPYVYSIIPFATMRPFEQIRNDICYQNLNVKIVGIGAGFAYGAFGSTHYGIEDISILRPLPNITVCSPADANETKALTLQSYEQAGPTYLRLLKPETALVPSSVATEIGKPSIVQDGQGTAIITTGAVLEIGLKACELLAKEGVSVRVISMHTIKPINQSAFVAALAGITRVVTIEEHRIAGGLAGTVAESLQYNGLTIPLMAFGVDDTYPGLTGHQSHLARHHGIEAERIVEAIKQTSTHGK